jgi:hypothetical protein
MLVPVTKSHNAKSAPLFVIADGFLTMYPQRLKALRRTPGDPMMISRARIFAISIFLITSTACASSGGPKATTQESSRDRVTSVEINATPASNAYDLVNRLRPQWLRSTGTSSMGGGTIASMQTIIYLDGSKIGGIESLKSISSTGIQSLEWISSTRAPIVFTDIGSDPVNGVISIKTK